jgi:hypothetical protein
MGACKRPFSSCSLFLELSQEIEHYLFSDVHYLYVYANGKMFLYDVSGENQKSLERLDTQTKRAKTQQLRFIPEIHIRAS